MKKFFNIFIEFDKKKVLDTIIHAISLKQKGYVCVVDGNVLAIANQDFQYLGIVNGALVNISDGSSIALLASKIHKQKFVQYAGAEILNDLIYKGYRQCFLGNTPEKLNLLKEKLHDKSVNVSTCMFEPLPFCAVEDFDFKSIADRINDFHADLIWVSLGAPKQERFISLLFPHLEQGIAFGIGAAIDFYVGVDIKRAPQLYRTLHLEWVYRLLGEPKRVGARAWNYLKILPKLIWVEYKQK